MGGRVYATDKGGANGEGDEARQFRSSGPGGRSGDLTRADGISEEAKRATSGCLGLREEPTGFGLASGGREGGQVCGRGQESRGSDVYVMTLRVRWVRGTLCLQGSVALFLITCHQSSRNSACARALPPELIHVVGWIFRWIKTSI